MSTPSAAAAAGLAAYQLAYVSAVSRAGVSIATLVARGLAPLLIAIGSTLLGHGRPRGTTLAALAVAGLYLRDLGSAPEVEGGL